MRYSQTSFYDGQFVDGKGRNLSRDIPRYKFKNDSRYSIENGFGLRQWDNLDVYKGNYKNGKRHGHGHLIMRNEQEEYEGTRLKIELLIMFDGVIPRRYWILSHDDR